MIIIQQWKLFTLRTFPNAWRECFKCIGLCSYRGYFHFKVIIMCPGAIASKTLNLFVASVSVDNTIMMMLKCRIWMLWKH